ncbi:MAG: hypothetical protein JWN70_474, partial [Planctomycetaceae bacterium]|nr:hypothetical protein [Planctomycetaceae bacterium]
MSSWLKNMFGGAKKPQKRRRLDAKSKILPQNLEQLENRTLLTTFVWDGGGDGSHWNDATNWVGDTKPDTTDDIVQFGTGTNTIADLAQGVGQIHFTGGGNTISIAATGLTIDGGAQAINLVNDAGANAINGTGDLTIINASLLTNIVGGTVTIGADIVGGQGLIVGSDATGRLILTGDNAYTGDTDVEDGILELNSAFGNASTGVGNLFIGDGDAIPAQVVTDIFGSINDTSDVTVFSDGLLNVGNNNEAIGDLTVVAGGTVTATGVFTVDELDLFVNSTETVTIAASSAAGGTATVGAGSAFNFNATSLVVDGSGDNTLTINNPAAGLFAPTGGITFNGATNSTLNNLGGGNVVTDAGVYLPTNVTDGTLTHTEGGVVQTITYSGLTPVTDTVAGATFSITAPAATAATITVVNGAVGTTRVTSTTFEQIDFANKVAVTVNGSNSADIITVNNSTPGTGLTTLNVNSLIGDDTVYVLATASTVTTNLDTGNGANDEIVLGVSNIANFDNGTGSLNGILGAVNTADAGGVVRVSVDASGDASATYGASATSVTRTGIGAIGLGSGVTAVRLAASIAGLTDVLNLDAGGRPVAITANGISLAGVTLDLTALNFETVNVTNAGAVTVNGDAGDNDLVVTATSVNSATLQLDGGAAYTLTGITSLTFDAGAGDDTLTINNPAGTVFGPTGGIFYNGQTQTTGDALFLLGGGGAAFNETYTPSAVNDGVLVTTNGVVTQTVTFTGLEPVTDTAAAATFTINGTAAADTINVVNGPGGTTQVNSNTFELVNFANKTAVTVNGVDGVDVITLDNTLAAAGLTAFNVFTGITAGSQVNVHSTPSGIVTTINSDGAAATVNVGNAGLLTGIAGEVRVQNAFDFTNLSIDDSADAVARNATLDQTLIGLQTFGQLTGLGNTAPILYAMANSGDVSAVTISAGTGGNTLLINQATAAGSPFTTTVNTGNGTDTVNVVATSANVTYQIHGQNGGDTANVGSLAPVTTGGLLAGIQGDIRFDNAGSFTAINIDDSGDAVGQTATLANPVAGDERLTGLGNTGSINWHLNDTASVVINGGAGGNTINVNVTDPLIFNSTVINSGTGVDHVNIISTTGALTVNAQDSDDVLTTTGTGLTAGVEVDLNGGDGDDSFVIVGVPTVGSDLNIDGQTQATAAGDSITMNGANINSIRHFLTSPGAGVIEYDTDALDNATNESDVDYVNLAPIFDNSNAVNRVFDYGIGDDQDVVIQDVGGAD